ncbi:hypothetical protein AZE42_09218 [Rhizopogon vesiculosus]|uniref:Uncharacterized protein n=1 Tax=Rhizopogon vesiculosus TaxID=180088 RepID=A0A1J8QBW3_9AGAM|nr:hypothetical protein AZE42_09218 [Rhizopogon vesiculosus]
MANSSLTAPSPSAEPYTIPQFMLCSTKLHADIRVPQPGSWICDVESEGDEEGKWDERLLRTAMNSGMHHAEHMSWRAVQSNRLMEMAQRPDGSVDVLLSDAEYEGGEGGKRVRVGKMRLNHGVLDISFAGSASHVIVGRVRSWRSSLIGGE